MVCVNSFLDAAMEDLRMRNSVPLFDPTAWENPFNDADYYQLMSSLHTPLLRRVYINLGQPQQLSFQPFAGVGV